MKYVRRAVYALLAGVLVNYLALITVPLSRAAMGAAAAWLGGLLALAGFVYINFWRRAVSCCGCSPSPLR